jgi:hypothetical protein
MARLGTQTKVVLSHYPRHQLARKMIAEITGHRAVDYFGKFAEFDAKT